MATGPGLPGPFNVYIPNHGASGNLVVGYSRNAAMFNLPKWCQYVDAAQPTGYYMQLYSQQQVRLVTQQEYSWPDGQYRPVHTDGMEFFNFLPFACNRYDYGFTIGRVTRETASWPLIEQHLAIHATKCMTARTNRMIAKLTTVANWQLAINGDLGVDHTGTASAFAGGYLDQGTTAAPYIRNFLTRTAVLIDKETAGTVKVQSDLMFILNPNQASLWGASQEIHDYIKQSPAAREEIINGLDNPNAKFGLPSQLYGYKILVENATIITTRQTAGSTGNPTRSYVMPDQQVLAVSRVGGIQGVEGGPSYTTATMFWFDDEMTVELFDDSKNRLIEGHVTEFTGEVLTSPLSGYLLTASTSTAGP